jgi:hypothetical protein
VFSAVKTGFKNIIKMVLYVRLLYYFVVDGKMCFVAYIKKLLRGPKASSNTPNLKRFKGIAARIRIYIAIL